MASPSIGFSPTSLIAPDLQTQLLANQRAQQLAQMLREQSIQPEQTQEVSGRVVPYGIGQGLTRLAQAFIGRRIQSQADQQMTDLNQQYAQQLGKKLKLMSPFTRLSSDQTAAPAQITNDAQAPDQPTEPSDEREVPQRLQVTSQPIVNPVRGSQGSLPTGQNLDDLWVRAQYVKMLTGDDSMLKYVYSLATPTDTMKNAQWMGEDAGELGKLDLATKRGAAAKAGIVPLKPGDVAYNATDGTARFAVPQNGVQTTYGPNGPTAANVPGYNEALANRPLTPQQQADLRYKWATVDPYGTMPGNPFAQKVAPGTMQVSDLTGDDLLRTLPQQEAAQVKALAEGRMQFPAGFALKSPYWQNMISMVSKYDPSFDAVNYNARSRTRQAFTSGQPATQINAMNTVIGHLKSLSDAADNLDNSSIPALNAAGNWLASNAGDPRVKQFDTTKKAVVDELTRVWRGNGGAEGDIKAWADQINAANSPAQLHGVIGQIGELLESKLNAMGEQYRQGMGTTTQLSNMPIQLITPQSRQVLDLLETRAGNSPRPQASIPQVGEVRRGYRFKGGDPSSPNSWEPQQ